MIDVFRELFRHAAGDETIFTGDETIFGFGRITGETADGYHVDNDDVGTTGHAIRREIHARA